MLTAAVLSDIETNLNYKQRQVPATHPLITDLQNYQLGWKQSIWRETGTVILVNYHYSYVEFMALLYVSIIPSLIA